MGFAFNAAVAATGTVSCAGTTTVTGTGTTFATLTGSAPGLNHARVGGTITVAGNTRTIVAIASTTSLTVDAAFGTFTNSAFTVQTGVTQTGTDTMSTSLGVITGFNVTNRGDLYRTFDVRGNDLYINGTLIVDSTVAQLRNDGSCNNRIVITGSANGGELRINGQKSVASNGPFPYPGFDWLGVNGLKVMALDSTNVNYPAKFTIIDACVRYGADWITTYSGNYSRITTQGNECWILCAKGTGTGQARLRQDNTTASIDFQAKQTWVGVWLNFGVPQISLKGYTPIYTDGPEINLASVNVATLVTIENYNTTYITPAYYSGAQIVLLGGAWTRIKNNLVGTNMVWRSMSPSGRNVLEFSKQVKATAKDATGALLSDGYFYFTPVGANVAGIRAKAMTSDITFDLSKKTLLLTDGSAETEFVYAWDYANSAANESTYEYFCTGTTKGAETHTGYVTRYGYDTQTVTMTLYGNDTFEATTVHTSLPTTDKVIANAAAITGVAFDFIAKSIAVSLSLTNQQVYDVYQYQLNLPANLGTSNESTVVSGNLRFTGWSVAVGAGATLSGTSSMSSLTSTSTITSNGIITISGVTAPSTSAPVIVSGTNSAYTVSAADISWTPAAYTDQLRFGSGSTFNLTTGSTLTVTPSTTIGTGTDTTAMFRNGSTLNMSDSVVTYNMPTGGATSVFSNIEGGATWNISNSTLTVNCADTSVITVHANIAAGSSISGLTINGTASNVVWKIGYQTSDIKLTNFTFGGAINGNGTSNILLDSYTYTGSLTTIPNTVGSSNKWWFVDPKMSNASVFRWAAGSTPTGDSGFYGVIGFRPVINIEKEGYAPTLRVKASTLTSRYATKVIETTAESTVSVSNFYRDPTFMLSSDGFLPFIDSLDDKTVLNQINWTLEFRHPGWLDQTKIITAASAKAGNVLYNASGAVDANYVNASTAEADMALITVNTSTKTIAPVTGTLEWSPQRLYNALKNWWETFASDVDFLSGTTGGYLDLGDYNVHQNLSFIDSGVSTDALKNVRTTGTIFASANGIPVTDTNGTSTIIELRNITIGSSIYIGDSSTSITKLYVGNAASDTYRSYFPATVTNPQLVARELFGYQRVQEVLPLTGGVMWYAFVDAEDVGLSESDKVTVEAYTNINTPDKFYDRTAIFRLTEQGIKLGQMVTRSGNSIEVSAPYSIIFNQSNLTAYSLDGDTITVKATGYQNGTKYNNTILVAPATATAATNEVISADIEDGNGNSSVTLVGGDGSFELWKITEATETADYATGTKLGDFTNGKFRFIGISGFDIVGYDINSNVRRRTSMAKGVYTQSFYVGDQIQLAQNAQVTQILNAVNVLSVDVAGVKGTGFNPSTDSLKAVKTELATKASEASVQLGIAISASS